MNSVTIKKDRRNKWRWRVNAANGRIIGASTQGYVRRSDCKRNMENVGNRLLDEVAP